MLKNNRRVVRLPCYVSVCVGGDTHANAKVIIAMQRLGKLVLATTNTHGAIQELLDTVLSMRSVSYQRKVGD
jgi:hypothetical protein